MLNGVGISPSIARRYGGSPPAESDPHWASVVALLHFDAADGATTFTDQKGHTFTGAGNAQIDTAQSVFGGSSLLVDGTGDWISSADSVDWDIMQGDHTIEGRFRWASSPGTSGFMGQSNGGGALPKWGLYWNHPSIGTNKTFLILSNPDNFPTHTNTFVPVAGTWYALAWVRTGNDWLFFVDGVLNGSVTLAFTQPASSSDLRIGADGENWQTFNGHIDEVRITKGVARYTSNYTIATAAFPNG